MGKALQNGVIINGTVYELVVDMEHMGNECSVCALEEVCHPCPDALCVALFDDAKGKRFEKVNNSIIKSDNYD